MEIHESFARVEHSYIEEKFGKVERELQSIITLFRTYVESGEEVFLTWAWENIEFLADKELNGMRGEWNYIKSRHVEAQNKTREAQSGAENLEVV